MKKIYLIICISSLALMLFGCSDKNSRNGGEESVTGSAAVIREDDAIEADQGASAESEHQADAVSSLSEETTDAASTESDEQTDTASDDNGNESIDPENADQSPAPQPVQEAAGDGKTESVPVQPAVVDQPVNVPVPEVLPDPALVIDPGQGSESQSSPDTDDISPVESDQASESSGDDDSEPQTDTSDDDTSEEEPETDENGCYMTEDGNWVCPMPGR